jgi:drug/metabolite transporter (DMT)-like permease
VDPANGGGKIDMKRRWNLSLWLGFLFALAGLFTYPVFAQYPVTRDFPWANLLLFCVGTILLGLGLVRAFRRPHLYRGKILGPIFATVALLVFAFFAYATFYVVRELPASAAAPRVGQKAPDFTLPDQNGRPVAFADLISDKGALLIFYRGYW